MTKREINRKIEKEVQKRMKEYDRKEREIREAERDLKNGTTTIGTFRTLLGG